VTERGAIADAVLAALRAIAPEIDPATLDPGRPLADQTDLDSMDRLELLTALSERYAIDIPATDGASLRSLDDIARYLAARGVA
jgi:acyl carrier protein